MFLRWAQGYNGSPARYIDKDVICYQCGSNVKFVAEDGAETVFNFKGNGVGPFAVHPNAKCFAVAEQCLNPKICIYVYPTFRELVMLEGNNYFLKLYCREKFRLRTMIPSNVELLKKNVT